MERTSAQCKQAWSERRSPLSSTTRRRIAVQCIARRGKDPRIMVDITKPEQQRMLVDQGKALLFFPKLKQVQEYFLGQNQDKAEFLLIGFGQSNQDIRKVYDTALVGEETINGMKTSILELKPKSVKASALFSKIRLWMDQTKWIPIQSQLTEASGDYMIVKIHEHQNECEKSPNRLLI